MMAPPETLDQIAKVRPHTSAIRNRTYYDPSNNTRLSCMYTRWKIACDASLPQVVCETCRDAARCQTSWRTKIGAHDRGRGDRAFCVV